MHNGAMPPSRDADVAAAVPIRATAFGVVTTRYDLRKLRAAQVLTALGAILIPVAGMLMAPTAVAVAAIVTAAAGWSLAGVRVRSSAQMKVQPRGLRLDEVIIDRDNLIMWRWRRGTATLYRASGNISVTSDQPAALEAILRSAFGDPREFSRRGSSKARIVAAAVFVAGVTTLVIGLAIRSQIAAVGAFASLCGFAVFGTLSQSVPNPMLTRKPRD